MAENRRKSGRVSVLVDNVSVTYRTFATGRRLDRKSNPKFGIGGKRGIREVQAVKNVSLEFHEGESVGVIGTNGSGKSTLMGAIAGLVPITKGAVYASSKPSLLGIGASLIPDLSGSRNIILGCLAMGMTVAQAEAKYQSIVEFSGIGEFIDLPMRTYSAGMGARLRFSIAASKDHEILIIDEALSVGDAEFRQRSEKRIKELRDSAATVFLVSHSMGSILDSSDRVIWLNKGDLVRDGKPEEVVEEYREFVEKLKKGK